MITSELIEAYLACPLKCYLQSKGEKYVGNTFAAWNETQQESYRLAAVKRLRESLSGGPSRRPLDSAQPLKVRWQFALDQKFDVEDLSARIFTFLRYDGVPWNNNNAEHAIKTFARLREIISGSSTKKGVDEYLTLLSVSETCRYRGVDFLDFLRSGERDVATFASSHTTRR